jgi:hypothetical protein
MEVTVQPVWRNVEVMIAVSGCFIFAGSDDAKAVQTHQTTHATVTNPQTYFLQLLSHSWPAVTAKAQVMLFVDMGQQHHVVTLTLADRTDPPSPEATRCDPQHSAQAFNGNMLGMFFDEGKSHLLNPAKNTVAFLEAPSPPSTVGSLCEAVHSPLPDQCRPSGASHPAATSVSILPASKIQRPDQQPLAAVVVRSSAQSAPPHV